MDTTIAFLFDSSNPALRDSEADACITATLKSILGVGAQSLRVRVRTGQVPLFSIVYRISSVEMRKTTSKATGSVQTTMSPDADRLNAIVWDLLDNLEVQWHTADLESLVEPLVDNALLSVTVFSLPVEVALLADESLRASAGYLGAAEVDLGNPVQVQLLCQFLVDQAVINNRSAWTRSVDEGETVAPSWTSKVGLRLVEVVSNSELARIPPLVPIPVELSENGKRTSQMLMDPMEATPGTILLREIVTMADVTEEPEYEALKLSTTKMPLLKAEVPEAKLTKYSLSFDHPKGRHKAHLFKELLGIEAKDWRYLAAQLLRGLNGAKIERVRLSKHGVKYSANIPVLGLNGAMKIVETGWIALNDHPPRLTTALVAQEGTDVETKAEKPPVAVSGSSAEENDCTIYAAALREAEAAASACIPTPFKFLGGPVVRGGMVGFAGVRIHDGRSRFARWLRKHGIGWRHSKKGWYVPAKTGSQSLDINRAYAAAFAEVLTLNGISCEVEWILD